MRPAVLLFLFLLFFFSVPARDKVVVTPAPDWLYPVKAAVVDPPAASEINNGYFLELVDRQVNIGLQTEFVHFIRNIVNESGVQNASEVSVTFSPAYQRVDFHAVNLIRDGAIVNRFTAGDIKVVQEETDVSDFQYNGTKRAFVIVQDVRKGDRIEASYSLTGFNPVFGSRFSTELYFNSGNPISNYFETIMSEASRKLYFTYFEKAAAPREETIGDMRVYHWSNPPLKLWETESGIPSWFNSYPYVVVTEYKNWKEVADWGMETFNHYRYDLPSALETRIAEWKRSAEGSQGEFARLAIRFVQDEIRYLGLEIGEHTHRPHTPGEVFRGRYGDCKDKSLLLTLILRQADIPAYVALLNTRKRDEMYKAASTPYEFNHAIVAIEGERGYQYIDPTLTFQRGDLPDIYIPAYGYALVLKEGENALRNIEPGFINSVNITETVRVAFEDTSRMDVYTAYKGGKADDARNWFNSSSLRDMRENYVQYYASIFEGISMDGDILYGEDSVRNEIFIREKYAIPSIWDENDGALSFNVYAKSVHQELTDPPAASKMLPIALKYPSTLFYTLKLHMPEKWNFPADALSIRNDSYEFEFTATNEDSLITLKYFFKTFKDHIPAAEVEQYRKDFKKMKEALEYQIKYTPYVSLIEGKKDGINWSTVAIAGAVAVVMGIIIFLLNRRRVEVEYDRSTAQEISGWQVVLIITLCLGLLRSLAGLLSGDYFSTNAWIIWEATGGPLLRAVIVELVTLCCLISSLTAVIYWFIKRRDILPQMFLGYLGLLVGIRVLLLATYLSISDPTGDYGKLVNEAIVNLVGSLIYAGIWGTYLLRSQRTRLTFLRAHR